LIIIILIIIFLIWIYSLQTNYTFKKNDFKEYFGNTLYVGNLSYSVRDGDLEQAFGQFGTVTSAKVMMERDTGRSKRFGFVEMGSYKEAQAAIQGMNEQVSGVGSLVVNEAIPMGETRPPRSGGYDGGGGGGGYGGGYNIVALPSSCPPEKPYWNTLLYKCIPCPSKTPNWDISLTPPKCVACPTETPNWDTSLTPPKCTPCPSTAPKWDITSKPYPKCVACPSKRPNWDISTKPYPKCIACPTKTPNWDLSSTPPKCISCPSTAPKWDITSKPYPKCVKCPKQTPTWNPNTQKCIIKIN